jgi:hypothetical protein
MVLVVNYFGVRDFVHGVGKMLVPLLVIRAVDGARHSFLGLATSHSLIVVCRSVFWWSQFVVYCC